ncbi:MAG: hypothetical protein FWD06_01585 [Oscillospiraceae bacterium]|nr:hypothetical protein [Oscillospiraceae bacterium]
MNGDLRSTLEQNLAPLLAWHNLPASIFEPSNSHQSIHAAGWLAHAVQCAQCELVGTVPPRDIHQHGEKWLTHSPQARDFAHDPRTRDIITQVLQGHTQSPLAQEVAQQLQQEPYLSLRKLQQQQPFCSCALPQLRAYLAWQAQLQAGNVHRVPFELALLHITHLHMQQDIESLRDFLQLYGPHDRSIARRLINLLRARGVAAQLPERVKPLPVLPPAPPAPEPRKPVEINFSQLDDIRSQADEMTELLLVDELPPAANAASPLIEGDVSIGDKGSALHTTLSPAQVATVNALLAGNSASELDIDAINEIAWQIIGDNLIEHGQIIQEYIDAWKEGTL